MAGLQKYDFKDFDVLMLIITQSWMQFSIHCTTFVLHVLCTMYIIMKPLIRLYKDITTHHSMLMSLRDQGDLRCASEYQS